MNFSLKRQSSAQTIETELDEEQFAISPYYLLPYDASEEDDDDYDYDNISLATNTRFLDVGWGGKDLQDLEDIDFEFVYALHTFVATVEGQANATKGDTMVLLDDSNSYWWLVRVVKDSSIGMSHWYIRSPAPDSRFFPRILTSRTHRDAYRKAGTSQQASEH